MCRNLGFIDERERAIGTPCPTGSKARLTSIGIKKAVVRLNQGDANFCKSSSALRGKHTHKGGESCLSVESYLVI